MNWSIRTLVALAAFTALWSCGDDDTRTVEDLPDTAVATPDVTPLERNACGGLRALTHDGEPASPGEGCGPCADGVLRCAGAEALICVEATTLNACESCGPLRAAPGEVCGPCGLGAWTCDDGGRLACEGDRDPNACGGCSVLPAEPGASCGSEAEPAHWSCVNETDLRCVPDDANVCGGESELGAFPGELCGTCELGYFVCESPEALACRNENAGANACGGCGALPHAIGDVCGSCGGSWQCTDDHGLACSRPLNACGGCDVLDAAPGEACEGGVWTCSVSGTLACAPEGRNLCGGESELAAAPGSLCGECFDGVNVCTSPETLSCVGATSPNTCGGCGALPGEPGDPCSNNAVWVCDGGTAACSVDIGLNACGGTVELGGTPGAACGTCDTGVLTCDGANQLGCEGEAAEEGYHRWVDADGDGFGDAEADPEIVCDETPGFADNNDDCNDESELYYPGAEEDSCGALADYNCDGEVNFVDEDDDGSPACVDCDDRRRDVYPGADEVCDGRDNDCDDEIDEDAGRYWFVDVDGDGHGSPSEEVRACDVPDGYAAVDDDCDDANPEIHGAAPELCDGIDNNCDDHIDDETAVDQPFWYLDRDGDLYGDASLEVTQACEAPEGHVAEPGDCDDTDPEIHPDAQERCDGVDNDCSGDADTDAIDRTTLYADTDGDGFGDPAAPLDTCPLFGYVDNADDCDDRRADVYPGAPERPADGVDASCDGIELCYIDGDGDTFVGDFSVVVPSSDLSCTAEVPCPDGVVTSGTCWLSPGVNPQADCNDALAAVYPGAPEFLGDGIDSNCDGAEICFRDADDDGYRPDLAAIVVSADGDCDDPSEALDIEPVGDCFDEGACADIGPGVTVCPASVNPGEAESTLGADLHGVDYDCSGDTLCFINQDTDGFRSMRTASVASDVVLDMCATASRQPTFVATEPDRCDDDGTIFPGASETDFDGVDQDCDGVEACYVDDDLDGYVATQTYTSAAPVDAIAAVVTDMATPYGLCSGERVVTSTLCGGGSCSLNVASSTASYGDCVDDRGAPRASITNPGRDDAPEVEAYDTNCDARDGVVGRDVYMRDDDQCEYGATTTPCTLSQAISLCADGSCSVLIEAGNYTSDSVNLRNGVDLYGGYASSWDARSFNFSGLSSQRTRITANAGQSQLLNGVNDSLTIHGVFLRGANVTGNQQDTAVLRINQGTMALERVRIEAGNGGNATDASNGSSGSNGGHASGRTGGSSSCGAGGGRGGYFTDAGSVTTCDVTYACSGTSYVNSSSGGTSRGGSAGTNRGRECGECIGDQSNGGGGGNASSGGHGARGTRSGDLNGSLSGTDWVPSNSNRGNTGAAGGGGGGGGRGESCMVCCFFVKTERRGGDGGGGGAGGCGGGYGSGGGQGGASIGLLTINANVSVDTVEIVRGRGGNGGDGGNGGRGGNRGNRAGGSDGPGCAGSGGDGGYGAYGGGGGGGAGGNGGPSIGVARRGGTLSGTPTYSGGTGGSAGSGGSGGCYYSDGSNCASGGQAGQTGSVYGEVTY